jgi:hypothetical protein
MARARSTDVKFRLVPIESDFSYERVASMRLDSGDVWLDPEYVLARGLKTTDQRLPANLATDILGFAHDYITSRKAARRSIKTDVHSSHGFAAIVGRTAFRNSPYSIEEPCTTYEDMAQAIMWGGRNIDAPKLGEWAVIGSRPGDEVFDSVVGLVDGKVILIDKPGGHLHVGSAKEILMDHYNLSPEFQPQLYAFRGIHRAISSFAIPMEGTTMW